MIDFRASFEGMDMRVKLIAHFATGAVWLLLMSMASAQTDRVVVRGVPGLVEHQLKSSTEGLAAAIDSRN